MHSDNNMYVLMYTHTLNLKRKQAYVYFCILMVIIAYA